mmetsp:Transcript_5867/g.15911  ORF Transcript_5867/g.15911 Transcript_5867/m.15911 type:complete len:226 (+) Transcript_5867:1011-1688(+)
MQYPIVLCSTSNCDNSTTGTHSKACLLRCQEAMLHFRIVRWRCKVFVLQRMFLPFFCSRRIIALLLHLRSTHLLAGTHDLIDEKQLAGQDRGQIQTLSLDSDVVPDALIFRQDGVARLDVETDHQVGLLALFPQLQHRALHVEPAVLRQSLWDDHEGIGECLDAKFRFSGLLGDDLILQVDAGGNLECSGARHDGFVLHGILQRSHSILQCILKLRQRVLIGSLQ